MSQNGFLDKVYSAKTDQQTLDFYEQWAATYDHEVSDTNDYMQPLRCAKALEKLVDPGDLKILDVGCGTGLAAITLDARGYSQIDGCDFSPEMLKKAEKTGVYQKLFEANLNEPPLNIADQFYDAIAAVGIFSFGHVSANAMDEILRMVKQSGIIIIGMNNHFYEEGSLVAKLNELESDGKIKVHASEHGDHLPGIGLSGWVISIEKL